MKLFNDMLARADRSQKPNDEDSQSRPIPVEADVSKNKPGSIEVDDSQSDCSVKAAVEDVGDLITMQASTFANDGMSEVQAKTSGLEPSLTETTKMASVANLRAKQQSELNVDDPMEIDCRSEVPIWELTPGTKTDPPNLGGDADESLSDLARAALQTIENRKTTGDDVAVARPVDGAPVGARAKTRLLGFHRDMDVETDVFSQKPDAPVQQMPDFPVGWLVVVEGPGRGAQFTLCDCVAKIGRGEDQAVRLDFGDSTISRDNHAAIAYDEEQNKFFLGHGGKANLVRLNGNPVLSTEEMRDGDKIRIGATTMRFVSLCGPTFAWCVSDEAEAAGG